MATVVHMELICSDEACALTVEAAGEPAELELMVCDGCGCVMQVVAVDEATELHARPPVVLALAA